MDIFTAVSLNNKIMTNDKKYDFKEFSTSEILRLRDEIRNKYKAIIVGANTIKQDNPTLLNKNRSNKRIIIDKYQDLSMDSKIFNVEPSKTYIIVSKEKKEYKKQIEEKGANYIIYKSENEICDEINKIGEGKVLLEGGAKIIKKFLELGEIEKISIIQFPILYSNDALGMFDYIEKNYRLNLYESEIIDNQFVYSEYKLNII